MLSALLTWFASKGVSLILGYAFNFALDLYKTSQANEAQREAGRAEVEAVQAAQGAKVEADLAEEAAKPISEDDAIAQLEKGDA